MATQDLGQYIKVPYPRQLQKKETLDSLSHWKSSVRNYFRRSSQYSFFFQRQARWNHSALNFGLTGEDAEKKADDLECLLDTLASFLPGPYITHQITTNSTSINSVWDVIWDHYGVKPTQHSFLDFCHLKKDPDERYIDLYNRMIYHSMNHLCPAGTPLSDSNDPNLKLKDADSLTTSHKNLIALNWLTTINSSLVEAVKLEYSKDLKSGIPLSSLVKPISENIDSLLARTSANRVAKVELSSKPDDSQVLRFQNTRFHGPNSNFRGGRGNETKNNFKHQQESSPMCKSCYSLGKRLSIYVNARHSSTQCPQLATVRSIQEHTETPEDETDTGNELELENNQDLSGNAFMDYKNIINKIRNIETRFQSTSVLKAKSPSTKVTYGQTMSHCIIDEGSELCCLDYNFVKQNNIPYSRTTESAVSAGSYTMKLMGQTDYPITVSVTSNNSFATWNLGQCIVVFNLGCPILIGEPGKSHNNIFTDPVKKCITTLDSNKNVLTLPYASSNILSLTTNNFICRIKQNVCLHPGDTLELEIPPMATEKVFFTPRIIPNTPPIPPQSCLIKDGKVLLKNQSDSHILVKKHSQIGDIVSSVPYTHVPTKAYSTYSVSIADEKYTDKVSIDPDELLAPNQKEKFNDLINEYSDVISPKPGKYNGYFGDVDCSLNFIKDPPASLKARLPGYSHDKLVVMANLMDEMESMGVLAKPEDVGIVPRNVHTSYLVPKTDATYRFVTDFTSLLPFIGKLEVVAPTIANAKRMISTFKYHAELDLSHCFWQGEISPADSQYLATPHPFGGLRIYVREPQGIRNASEHNSERLARIFGDLEQASVMCRMADGLYVGGDSVDDLISNLQSVFHRARLCGITFKPSKIIICPQKTILFGWEKNGSLWSPTSHVITPLSQAPRPKTVKQLRGFIGAYRQLSTTIPKYSTKLSLLEKYVGGKTSKEHIQWNDDLLSSFENAKLSLNDIKSIVIPTPDDTLHIYPDFSENTNAIGAHLILHRNGNDPIKLNGGYFSIRLEDCQTRWTPCEKECLGIKLSINHFKPFIQNSKNCTYVHTDNLICVQAWNRLKQGQISTSSKVASFLSCLSENNIEILHFPGSQTKVADWSSRNPLPCTIPKCQVCNFAFQQTKIGDLASVMSIAVSDLHNGNFNIPLHEKPTWLKLQKQDETHRLLHRLITSGGLQPEPKLRGHTDLKRLYNLYKKGLLSLDPSGLITVKYIDGQSGIEYNAISVPKHLYSGLVQSIHIKLNHPSRAQMHKFLHRYFFCIGLTVTVDSVHSSCQTCMSLTTLPKFESIHTTTQRPKFGSFFSADVLVESGQKIFICRENLSQFTISCFIEDESVDTIRNAILSSVLEYIPPEGTTVRVDPAPANKTLSDISRDNLLRKYNIKVELGRVHNKNKNPIAENAIKEFRKELLKLSKGGGPISEHQRIIITSNINQRIRYRGLSAKEILLRRELMTNDIIDISDQTLSNLQHEARQHANDRHNQTVSNENITFNVGDRVFINGKADKTKAREEHIIITLFEKEGLAWSTVQKTEKGFRNIEYDVPTSQLVPVSTCFAKTYTLDDSEDDLDPMEGFASPEIPTVNPKLSEAIVNLEKDLPKSRGRPKKKTYPDYIRDEYNQSPKPSTSKIVNKIELVSQIPTHGWNEEYWKQLLDEEDEICFLPLESPTTEMLENSKISNKSNSDSSTSDIHMSNNSNNDVESQIVDEPQVSDLLEIQPTEYHLNIKRPYPYKLREKWILHKNSLKHDRITKLKETIAAVKIQTWYKKHIVRNKRQEYRRKLRMRTPELIRSQSINSFTEFIPSNDEQNRESITSSHNTLDWDSTPECIELEYGFLSNPNDRRLSTDPNILSDPESISNSKDDLFLDVYENASKQKAERPIHCIEDPLSCITPNRVCDATSALEQINIPIELDMVQDVSATLDLFHRGLTRSCQPLNYRILHIFEGEKEEGDRAAQ